MGNPIKGREVQVHLLQVWGIWISPHEMNGQVGEDDYSIAFVTGGSVVAEAGETLSAG